jgi:hypothetical protein
MMASENPNIAAGKAVKEISIKKHSLFSISYLQFLLSFRHALSFYSVTPSFFHSVELLSYSSPWIPRFQQILLTLIPRNGS